MGKVLVLGMGVSGKAAAQLLLSQGHEVIGMDAKPAPIERVKVVSETEELQFGDFAFVVLSPGVSPKHPIVQKAVQAGCPVIGEAELALRSLNQPMIGITGTNGKTTVTLLVEHILKQSGRKARALGNIGTALSSYALNPDRQEILVIELSSFQLEMLQAQTLSAGIILNITPDHLDRYENMEAYAAAKIRMHRCLQSKAPFYVHEKTVAEFSHLFDGAVPRSFGTSPSSHFYHDGTSVHCQTGVEFFFPLSYRRLGKHDLENALAAWMLCREFGVSRIEFICALESFVKPPHRIEFVREIKGVSYYDDSKGTNIDAVVRAVETMRGNVILIAGGIDKGSSYAPWLGAFRNKVKKIIAIGQAADKIAAEIGKEYPVEIRENLSEAVQLAHGSAQSGENVLLSPGCASFDMFRDYAHRGEEFKRCVDLLLGEK